MRTDARYFARAFFRHLKFNNRDLIELSKLPIQSQDAVLKRLLGASRRVVGPARIENWNAINPLRVFRSIDDAGATVRLGLMRFFFYRDILNAALASQQKIESEFFEGNFNDCDLLIEEDTRKNGVSLWSIQIQLLCSQFKSGYHGNRTTLSRLQKSTSSDWIKFLTQNFSYRAQMDVPTQEYLALHGLGVRPQTNPYGYDSWQFRLLDSISADERAITNVLHSDSQHSLIDHFYTTLRVLSTNLNAVNDPLTQTSLRELSKVIESPELRVLSALASDGEVDTLLIDESLLTTADAHLCDRHIASLDGAISLLKRSPCCFFLLNVAASSAARQAPRACPILWANKSPVQNLLETLYEWYCPNRPRAEIVEKLRRLSRAYASTRLGPGLLAFVEAIDADSSPLGPTKVSPIGSFAPVPQNALSYSDSHRALCYLDNLERAALQLPSIDALRKYFHSLQSKTSTFERLTTTASHGFQLRLEGAFSFNSSRFSTSHQVFRDLRLADPSISIHYPETLSIEVCSLIRSCEFEQVATVVTDVWIRDRHLISPAILRQIGSLLLQPNLNFDNSNIGWSILAKAVYDSGEVQLSLDRVHDFVGDFIESHGATKLSELTQRIDITDPRTRVYLNDCCTTDILESSIWYNSQPELFLERLSLCTELLPLSKDNETSLRREIADLTRQLAVFDLTNRVERSRIYVDVDDVAKSLDKSYLQMITTLLSIRALLSLDLKRGLQLLSVPDNDERHFVFVTLDQDQQFFDNVFEKLKDTFLHSPEYGLDSNLSQRIRHGTLGGELRAIYDRHRLTTKTDAKGCYAPNVFWVAELASTGQVLPHEYDICFQRFSKAIDSKIRLVREQWIQIRSPDKKLALFDYTYTENEKRQLLTHVADSAEVGDVIDVICNALIVRTELCLDRVREAINCELAVSLEADLDTLLSDVSKICENQHCFGLSKLRDAVTLCKTDMRRELDKLSGWFRLEDKHQQKSFIFSDLVASVVSTMERVGSPCDVGYATEPPTIALCGTRFSSLWDLLHILFDNATRHSRIQRPTITLCVEFFERSTFLSCSNTVVGMSYEECQRIALTLNGLSLSNKDDLNKIRQEGGSGIAKLHRIVRHELLSGGVDYIISISVSQAMVFCVEINFEKGLLDAASGC